MPLCQYMPGGIGRGGIPRAHRAPRAAVLAAASAAAARRLAATLATEPGARAHQVHTLRERGLHRPNVEVDELARRRLAVERQAAAVLREHELRRADTVGRHRRRRQGLR